MSVPRMETLGSLLAAMAVVALTGSMPEGWPAADIPHQFDVLAKPKIIVPLSQRYSGLLRYAKAGRFKGCGYRLPFSPTRVLEERFGLQWVGPQAEGIIDGRVMPSTVQVAVARHMADGDPDLTSSILTSRATKGIRVAEREISNRFNLPNCYVTALWRFGGNADVLWYAMRDEMEEAVRTVSGGAE